jgi:uncharacterized coiled-coil DUF342 family protein
MADETSKKKDIEQLKNAEKKYQSYIEKRNELNDLAKVVREERDMLNAKHKEIRETMDKARKERDELVKKMKEHKEIRNKLQQQAKQFIEARRQKKGEVFKNLPLRVEELKADVQMLEYRQETVVMSPSDENELIDKIREKKFDYERTKKQMDEQKLLEIDISDKDKTITELFKKADEQHEMVKKFYKDSQKKHKEYIELVRELSIQINESNKKHEQFIETKNEAQRNHEKAVELRSRIIAIRGEKRKQREDARRAIIEQNKMARNAVLDEKKLGEIADKSVLALKKGKKITL